MCLIVLALRFAGRYPLVVAGNRDEFYARPTRSACWSDDGRVLAGRDLRGGGTWMGVTRDGRFTAVTNHRDSAAMRPDAPSRGLLCDRVLLDGASPARTLAAIAADGERYNGFNLLGGSWAPDGRFAEAGVLTNGTASPAAIDAGVHGLSNARLDTPWPKVELATLGLKAALADDPGPDVLVARLLRLLADPTVAADALLPSTGVPLDTERALSATFIRLAHYGTRSSTVLLVDDRGRVTFVERRCEPGAPVEDLRYAFPTAALNAARAS